MTGKQPRCALIGIGEDARLMNETLADNAVGVEQLEAGELADRIGALDLVFLSLSDEDEAAGVMRALAAAKGAAGAILIDISDGEPSALSAAAAAGVEDSDAIADGAMVQHYPEEGARVITLLVGGGSGAFERVSAHLGGAFRAVLHAGAFGAAHLLRALINTMFMTMKGAAEEITEVASRHGIPPADMLSIINTSSGESAATKVLAAQLAEKTGANADLFRPIESGMEEDVRAIERVAEGVGIIPLFTRRTAERLAVKGRGGTGGKGGS